LYFQADLEYHYVPVPHKCFIEYDQTIANDVGLAYLELVLPQICLYIIISDSNSSCVAAYST
jgi:hypothetical protein